MRLLKYDEDGDLIITSFDDNELPPYAILSHTWGAEGEEVTFADLDLAKGSCKAKPGYKKIRFCGEQAQLDGLQYFWIDTCCINKANKAELAFAIRCMFRWYQNATRCYVHLSDVSTMKRNTDYRTNVFVWRPAFMSSRWFTRGWTLQELLAPSFVEFFSKDGEKLGDKLSLTSLLRKVTGIPDLALQGTPLFDFTVSERISWTVHRQTTIPVDSVYSIMGILGVSLSPFDGESLTEAMKRVMDEVDRQTKCLQDLQPSNPRDDKMRIEETKGGLLEDAYHWILGNDSFRQWRNDANSHLLWVKGDPGKGKTMLLCGIINELQRAAGNTITISYFFCQATDSRINSATAVLRGLLYMLVIQQPFLISHIRKKYDRAGKTVFEDVNAWVALTDIWADVLQDPGLRTTNLIIDALDECIIDRPKLLEFIAMQSSTSLRIKWIVSSRNWLQMGKRIESASHKVTLSLELNAESVSIAVNAYIKKRVSQLPIGDQGKYDKRVQDVVAGYIMANADNTFLWVALACQILASTTERNVMNKLKSIPPGLEPLYKRMMHQITESDNAEICRYVLASTAVLYRPVTIPELVVLTEQLKEHTNDLKPVREIVSLCGSFLTLHKDTVYFVHQSAKDFLLAKASDKVFPDGIEDIHRAISFRSLAILSRSLHRNMYNIVAPGFPVENVEPPNPDPLAVSRYPCLYWIDHLCESEPQVWTNSNRNLKVLGVVDLFLKQKFLYWLEGLILCKSLGKGVVSVSKLWSLLQGMRDQDQLIQLVQDARQFVMYHKQAIESYPLQIYMSALLFSPTGSLIKRLFQREEPKGISIRPAMSDGWSACLQTLEGHSNGVTSVAFSHDSARLASASRDKTVKIWDTSSGMCLQTLEGHSNVVSSVAFSHDSTQLASASDDGTIKIWYVSSGACLQTLNISGSLDRISFDKSGLYLQTNIGLIKITVPIASNLLQSVVEPQNSQYRNFGLSTDGSWITHYSHNLVHIPLEHRPSCSAVLGETIGVGVGSGRVWIYNIQLDTTRKRREEIEEVRIQASEVEETSEPLQVTGQTAKISLYEETAQGNSRQTERSGLQSGSGEASTYGRTTIGHDEFVFTGQTLFQRTVLKTSNEELTTGTLLSKHIRNDYDIRSIISREDDNKSQLSILKTRRSREIENAVVSVLATDYILAPIYGKALQLVPKERFVDNFRRILMLFYEDLKQLEGTLLTQELAAVLRLEEARERIARKTTDRYIFHQQSLSEQDLRRDHSPDESNFSYLEAWLAKTNFPPHFENALRHSDTGVDGGSVPSNETKNAAKRSGEDASDEEEQSAEELESGEEEEEKKGRHRARNMDMGQFPRLEFVIQKLVEGEPFRNMIARMKESLLPNGLLRDILSVPRESITYESSRRHSLLNAIQGLLEDLTKLEWDWWPLPPRMRLMNEGETRVSWQCLCGKIRSRTLKVAQRHILEDILDQYPEVSQRPLLCASSCSPALRANPQPRLPTAPDAQPQSVPNPLISITAPTAVRSSSTNTKFISLSSDGLTSTPTSRGPSSAPGHSASAQSNYQQKKPFWFIFKIEGSPSAPAWDQFGDEGMVTDRSFQQKLMQRHNELRGPLRLWFSYWRLSYWEFVKLQKTRPGRLVDRGIDLPMTPNYEYFPRPPDITARDPWISKHEFEEIVKSCITPCWLNYFQTLLGFHDCACPAEDAKRLIGALPKRDSEFMINHSGEREDYVWGIHARYVVSARYVFCIHVAILAITLGLWIWWQRKHPDDLQGASVPMTVAGICISTFWGSTGILNGLR